MYVYMCVCVIYIVYVHTYTLVYNKLLKEVKQFDQGYTGLEADLELKPGLS